MFHKLFIVIAVAAFVAGCSPAPNNSQSTPQQQAPAATPAPAPRPRAAQNRERTSAARPAPVCSDCGAVTAITPVKTEGKPSLLGTLAGAAAGGFAGSQFGKGQGKTAMTAAGVVGGAFAERAAEGKIRSDTTYQVSIAMDNGSSRQITLQQTNGLTVGAKVRVNGNTISPR